ncbi:MAG: hypothetical protein IZT58_07105 [Actinobacteria bacterium]|nr:hypothetical protein [Actinomycetota bacterium]
MTRIRLPRATIAVATLVCCALISAACSGGGSSSSDSAPEDLPATGGGDDESPAIDDVATTDAPVVDEGQVVEDVVESEDAGEETRPAPGGTLRFALEADASGLNPTTSPLSAPGRTMANAVFDTLMAMDADGNPVPYLAESIEPVDGDLTRWRLVVREGIVFHDGTPLTADAVQVNYEAQLASPLIGLAQLPFFPAEGATTVIDDRTIEFSMLDPNAVFPAWLTSQLGMVASPDWLAAAAEDPELNQEPVGTGPFVFDSRSKDSITRVVRNDEWWGGEVYLDAVEFRPVSDPATRADLLFGGEIEGLHTIDPAIVGDLRDDDSVQNVIDETGQEQFVQLNAAVPPFDDVRARKALVLATPLQLYRDLIGLGIARGADQMFIPESNFYNPDVVQQGDDPVAAAALAAEYCADVPDGCSDGKIDVKFQFPSTGVVGARQAEILDRGWGEVFNVDFDQLSQPEHIQQVAFGQYQAALWRAFGSLEPATQRHALMCRTIAGGISLNGPRFCSEARDALILDAQAQLDEAARVADWQGIVQDMNDAFTYVFLLHTVWDNVFNESVRGVCDRTSPDGVPLRCVVNGVSWFDSVWLSD